jgi:hypothetical protein
VLKLQHLALAAYGLFYHLTGKIGKARPVSLPAIENMSKLTHLHTANGQMHEDYNISHRARQRDTLSAEDLGILL